MSPSRDELAPGPQEPVGQRLEHSVDRTAEAPVQWDSKRLFEGQRELIIHHQGEQYRLRITRQDKLILTK